MKKFIEGNFESWEEAINSYINGCEFPIGCTLGQSDHDGRFYFYNNIYNPYVYENDVIFSKSGVLDET